MITNHSARVKADQKRISKQWAAVKADEPNPLAIYVFAAEIARTGFVPNSTTVSKRCRKKDRPKIA